MYLLLLSQTTPIEVVAGLCMTQGLFTAAELSNLTAGFFWLHPSGKIALDMYAGKANQKLNREMRMHPMTLSTTAPAIHLSLNLESKAGRA